MFKFNKLSKLIFHQGVVQQLHFFRKELAPRGCQVGRKYNWHEANVHLPMVENSSRYVTGLITSWTLPCQAVAIMQETQSNGKQDK